MQRFDFSLTQQDLDLTTEFMMYCDQHGLDDFTSDTFSRRRGCPDVLAKFKAEATIIQGLIEELEQ